MAIRIVDDKGGVFEFGGAWQHKSGFIVDRDRLSVREVAILADRGLTHVIGSEAAAKYNGLEKKGEAKPEDRDRIVNEAREEYREAMYNDAWATGTRVSRATPVDRITQLMNMDIAKTVKDLLKGLQKQGKDMWLDTEGNAFPLEDWIENYMSNDLPDENEPGKTKGQVRAERHRQVAEEAFAREQRNKAQQAETRRIVGTKI